MLSVVIPVYNEGAVLEKTASVICGVLSDAAIGCELIFVDDGSKDATWEKITALSASGGIRGLHFSRNFGKEAAILAGLAAAKGDCCVVIDGDLQHPPEKIVEMYRLWEQGYEIVEGQKASRGAESHAHGLAARAFYSLISRATGIDMANASDFKLLDRKAVNVLINMRERNAFFRALSSWIGFKTVSIPFDVQKRAGGSSKWSTPALAKYAVDNIASFSAAPMQLVTVLGGIMLLVSLVLGTIALVQKFSGRALGQSGPRVPARWTRGSAGCPHSSRRCAPRRGRRESPGRCRAPAVPRDGNRRGETRSYPRSRSNHHR